MTELPNAPKDPTTIAWVLTHERSIVDGRKPKPTLQLAYHAKQIRQQELL